MLSMSANLLLFTESRLFPSLPVKNLENQPPPKHTFIHNDFDFLEILPREN